MNNIDRQYTELLDHILHFGVDKQDRTGTGTKSIFGWQIRHNMKEGFPLITTKKMYFKGIVTELLWFLRGDTNIKYLVDNGCHIWDGDAYKNYEKEFEKGNAPGRTSAIQRVDGKDVVKKLSKEDFILLIKTDNGFAKKWGELGPIYGQMWRDWDADTGEKIDQIANLISELKTNPDSRRLMVNAWNVVELDKMVLPPCHYGFQVYTRELSLEERFLITDKVNKEIRQDLYSYSFNNPLYVGEVTRSDDEERHLSLDDLNIPTRAISLMWNQRSVDTFLGLPFNIASYALLLEIIAKEVNMVPEELIGNLGDVHLYNNHIEQAKEQIGRKYTHEEREQMLKEAMGDLYQTAVDEQVPFGGGMSEYYETYKIPYYSRMSFELPKLLGKDEYYYLMDVNIPFVEKLEKFKPDFFTLENYQSHPAIKAPLSN